MILGQNNKAGIDIHRLPVNSEEHSFHSWQVSYKQSHILHSKCLNSSPCGENERACLFCVYNQRLELPHMPDMVFPNNKLVLKHASDCVIEFNALDALKRVSNGKLSMKVACADAWKESRQEAENLDEVKPFDWTFTTDYKGTLLGNFVISSTEERINLDKLRQREKILFYHDLTLFEDELHDNGIAVCSVKIRVMPSSFFILLRYFLRVDNVMVRLNDTRFYHEFQTDFVLREYTSREAKVKDLKENQEAAQKRQEKMMMENQEEIQKRLEEAQKRQEERMKKKQEEAQKRQENMNLEVPAVQLIEPSEVAQILPLIKTEREKLSFPQNMNEAGEGSTVPAT